MVLITRLRIFIIVQCIIGAGIAGGLGWLYISPVWICLFIASQIVALCFVYFRIQKPLIDTEAALDLGLEHKALDENMWEILSRDIIFYEKIRAIVEFSVAQKTRENTAEIFDKEAKLAALQSQINPHFLYNTLESIRGQALIDGNEEIAKMVKALSSFFRYSISRKGSLVTLRGELTNIQNYMMIQQYRFHNRFSLEIVIDEEDDEAYDYLIPKLIIQPVVENAIFHGLEERLEGGEVVIEVIVTEKNLILTVMDNGIGMEDKKLKELNERIHCINPSVRDSKGIALPNIHKRIQLLFGEEYGVQVYSTPHQGTDVEIMIPANYERSAGSI